MFLIFDFDYSALQFNSAKEALIPNMTALGLVIILGIFLPWLTTYLFMRKKEEQIEGFKDWLPYFLKSSIGTIALISLPIFGFVMYYISRWGAYPNWNIPYIADYYGFMVITNLSSFIYVVVVIFFLILWFGKRKDQYANYIS